MISPLTRSALDRLPAEIRDNILVLDETGYSITMSMTIGDLERLVGHFATLSDLRDAIDSRDEDIRHGEALIGDLRDMIEKSITLLWGLREDAHETGEDGLASDLDKVLAELEK